MAVNIDTVYQKVLALANKEQRGYITPQEFNLLANKAQKDIINDYFHGLKTAYQKPKNQTEVSDEAAMLREKLSFIRNVATIDISVVNNISTAILPSTAYMIATVFLQSTPMTEVQEVDRNRLLNILANPLTAPTENRPLYLRQLNTNGETVTIELFPSDISATQVNVDYWEGETSANAPNWAYVVVNQKALYNFSNSVHFRLHPSEEEPLVMRILQLAGIVIEKSEITQSVMVDKQTTKQNQNS